MSVEDERDAGDIADAAEQRGRRRNGAVKRPGERGRFEAAIREELLTFL